MWGAFGNQLITNPVVTPLDTPPALTAIVFSLIFQMIVEFMITVLSIYYDEYVLRYPVSKVFMECKKELMPGILGFPL